MSKEKKLIRQLIGVEKIGEKSDSLTGKNRTEEARAYWINQLAS